ncbi:MAG: FemAB family PEP-CTERM system-associated protein [Pirellulaceae bacterium]|nr:FemAB family PEP-CTERM system-associated protein [Pirellulaceae bacterium]
MTSTITSTITSATDLRTELLGPDADFETIAVGPSGGEPRWLSYDPRWLAVLRDGLRQLPYCVQATRGERVVGTLPLMYVRSYLFGRYLVGLPYLNYGGVRAEDDSVARQLVDRAVQLADDLQVKRLELRHEVEQPHPSLTETLTSKAHLRLALPATADVLWDSFKPKVRNQIRKGESQGFEVRWGTHATLDGFYEVFSRNMRDLGTPVFGRRLFQSIIARFPDQAEFCVVQLGHRPVAAALLTHGCGVTEVPSASSLREYNSTNANMFMYWQLLQRAIERRQQIFDFGRSSVDGNHYRFKRQWGAEPHAAVWQYYVRQGSVGDLRPENPRLQRAIRLWQRLPVAVSNILGPPIVRNIP